MNARRKYQMHVVASLSAGREWLQNVKFIVSNSFCNDFILRTMASNQRQRWPLLERALTFLTQFLCMQHPSSSTSSSFVFAWDAYDQQLDITIPKAERSRSAHIATMTVHARHSPFRHSQTHHCGGMRVPLVQLAEWMGRWDIRPAGD